MHKKINFVHQIFFNPLPFTQTLFQGFSVLYTHPVLDFWLIDILKLLLHIQWKANEKRQKLVFEKHTNLGFGPWTPRKPVWPFFYLFQTYYTWDTSRTSRPPSGCRPPIHFKAISTYYTVYVCSGLLRAKVTKKKQHLGSVDDDRPHGSLLFWTSNSLENYLTSGGELVTYESIVIFWSCQLLEIIFNAFFTVQRIQ